MILDKHSSIDILVDSHITYIIMIFYSICFSEFSKRFIFIIGEVNNIIYYTCVFFPIFFVFIYIFSGNLKIDIQKCIFFFLIFIFEFFIVLISNVSNIGKLIVYFGSVLFYVFPFVFTVFCKTRKYSYFFLFLLTITVMYGVIQHSVGYFIWDRNWGKFSPSVMDITALGNWGSFTRAFSFFSGVQDFALFIIFTTILLWINSKGYFIKLVLIMLLISGLYISGAKAMMVSLIVAFLAYYLQRRINYLFLFLGLYILPYILIMGLYIILKNDIVRILSPMTGLFTLSTIIPRLEIVYAFFSSIKDSFDISSIFGVGFGCIEGTVDNMYIRILVETGIIGFIIFMYFIYSAIKRLYYIKKRTTQLSSSGETFLLFLVFVSMTFSMHSGELLMSRYAMTVFVYIIICINKKYRKIKEYELIFLNTNSQWRDN
jgi:hypothetical protein